MKLNITVEDKGPGYKVDLSGDVNSDALLIAIADLVQLTATSYRQVGAPDDYIVKRIAHAVSFGLADGATVVGNFVTVDEGKIKEARDEKEG